MCLYFIPDPRARAIDTQNDCDEPEEEPADTVLDELTWSATLGRGTRVMVAQRLTNNGWARLAKQLKQGVISESTSTGFYSTASSSQEDLATASTKSFNAHDSRLFYVASIDL